MQKVKLSNGTILNFPDEMSQEKIKSVIQNKFPVSSPEMVDTFVGKIQKNPKEFQFGSPENKAMIDQMISAGAGAPGMQVAGNVAMKIPSAIKTLFSKIDPKKLVSVVQRGHDLLHDESKGIYDLIKKKAKDMKISIGKDVLQDADDLTKSKSLKKIIDKASQGDYNSLHSLQSELGELGSKGLSSDLPSEVLKGKDLLDVRERINDAIESHFINSGQPDLAHLLRKGRSLFKEKMDTYYDHSGIGKMVHPKIRKTPRNILNFFSEESVPMNKVTNKHPEIPEMLGLSESKKNMIKNLKGTAKGIGLTGLGAGGIASSIYGTRYLLNKLLGESD